MGTFVHLLQQSPSNTKKLHQHDHQRKSRTRTRTIVLGLIEAKPETTVAVLSLCY